MLICVSRSTPPLSSAMLTSITVFFVIDRMTDINGKASQVSIKTMSQNKVTTTDAITTNVTEALENRLLGTVDILLCNPPYVLTPSHEVSGYLDCFDVCCHDYNR